MRKPQAPKRQRTTYRTAADRSTKSRQQAHATGGFTCTTRVPNPFRVLA